MTLPIAVKDIHNDEEEDLKASLSEGVEGAYGYSHEWKWKQSTVGVSWRFSAPQAWPVTIATELHPRSITQRHFAGSRSQQTAAVLRPSAS